MRLSDWQVDADEHSRGQQPHAAARFGVREDASKRDAAGGRIKLVVDEIDGSAVRKAFLALQADVHRELTLWVRLNQACVSGSAKLQNRRLVHVEVDVYWVQRHDRGEQSLVLVDEVALRQVIAAHLTGDWCDYPGEPQVEPVNLEALPDAVRERMGFPIPERRASPQ